MDFFHGSIQSHEHEYAFPSNHNVLHLKLLRPQVSTTYIYVWTTELDKVIKNLQQMKLVQMKELIWSLNVWNEKAGRKGKPIFRFSHTKRVKQRTNKENWKENWKRKVLSTEFGTTVFQDLHVCLVTLTRNPSYAKKPSSNVNSFMV